MSQAAVWMADPSRHPQMTFDDPNASLSPDALEAWKKVRDFCLAAGREVKELETIAGRPGSPVLATAGLLAGESMIPARLPRRYHLQEDFFRKSLRQAGFQELGIDIPMIFQGSREFLNVGQQIFFGVRSRADFELVEILSDVLDAGVTPLELKDSRVPHLDFCAASLGPDSVCIWEDALTLCSKNILRDAVSEIYHVTEPEFLSAAAGLLVFEKRALLPQGCPQMKQMLAKQNFKVEEVDFSKWAGWKVAPQSLVLRSGLFQPPQQPGRFRDSGRPF